MEVSESLEGDKQLAQVTSSFTLDIESVSNVKMFFFHVIHGHGCVLQKVIFF